MGGSIGFGVRYQDASGDLREVYMSRWTNDLFWRISSVSFLTGGSELTNLIEEAREENRGLDPKLLPEIIPQAYGLVLVDFPSGEIFSWNHYCDPLRITVSSASTAFTSILANVIKLIRAGYISRITRLYSRGGDSEITPEVFFRNFRDLMRQRRNDRQQGFPEAPGSLLVGSPSYYFFQSTFWCYINSERFPVVKPVSGRAARRAVEDWLREKRWVTPLGEWLEEED